MSGMPADFAPILWFRAGSAEDGEDARRGFTAAGVLRLLGVFSPPGSPAGKQDAEPER